MTLKSGGVSTEKVSKIEKRGLAGLWRRLRLQQTYPSTPRRFLPKFLQEQDTRELKISVMGASRHNCVFAKKG
jgi:hypothetical protein